jgi:hypothetical protein
VSRAPARRPGPGRATSTSPRRSASGQAGSRLERLGGGLPRSSRDDIRASGSHYDGT